MASRAGILPGERSERTLDAIEHDRTLVDMRASASLPPLNSVLALSRASLTRSVLRRAPSVHRAGHRAGGHRAPAGESRAPDDAAGESPRAVTDVIRLGPHAGLRVARGLSCGRGDVASGFARRCAEVRALRGEKRGLWGLRFVCRACSGPAPRGWVGRGGRVAFRIFSRAARRTCSAHGRGKRTAGPHSNDHGRAGRGPAIHGRTRAAHLVSLCASGLLVLVAAVCKTLKGIEGYDETVCTLGRRGRAEGA
jgi:hypothetical protein